MREGESGGMRKGRGRERVREQRGWEGKRVREERG